VRGRPTGRSRPEIDTKIDTSILVNSELNYSGNTSKSVKSLDVKFKFFHLHFLLGLVIIWLGRTDSGTDLVPVVLESVGSCTKDYQTINDLLHREIIVES